MGGQQALNDFRQIVTHLLRTTMRAKILVVVLCTFTFVSSAAEAETTQEWIQLGTRTHGFFGGFIPVGIRIGLDARERLKAEPRGLTVTYYKGAKAPCPCIADGVLIATQSSPGQGTLNMAPEAAMPGALAVILIRNRTTGQSLRYIVSEDWLPTMLAWNKLEPEQRFEAAMGAANLFSVEPHPAPQ